MEGSRLYQEPNAWLISDHTVTCVSAHEYAYAVGTGQDLRGENSEWLEEEGSRRKVSDNHVKFWR
jgi:hypothetical protein